MAAAGEGAPRTLEGHKRGRVGERRPEQRRLDAAQEATHAVGAGDVAHDIERRLEAALGGVHRVGLLR